jgi:hypothetical protein
MHLFSVHYLATKLTTGVCTTIQNLCPIHKTQDSEHLQTKVPRYPNFS